MAITVFTRVTRNFVNVFRKFSSHDLRLKIDKLKSLKDEVILDFNDENGIALLAMNYQSKRNALSKSFVSSMSNAVTELEVDIRSKAVIICSLVNLPY